MLPFLGMDGDIDRRRLIVGGLAALANLSSKAVGAEEKLTILPSTLTREHIERQKRDAIASLQKSIPPDHRLNYLRNHTRNLAEESQMYIPTEQELRNVIGKSESALATLAGAIHEADPGLFIFADANENGERVQRLYVVQKTRGNSLRFVKGYRVSMSEAGFGNDKNSGQTPLGLHTIHNGKRGIFGEVVSGLNKHKHLFNHVRLGGIDHWFVKSFGERTTGDQSNDVAEVVTDQYLLAGPQTNTSRGIRIHGTNRSGFVSPNGTWVSFLGGVRRSGGCIRMSNTDVRDLSLSGYIWTPQSPDRNDAPRKEGTVVMIYATEKGRRFSGPERWKPSEDAKVPANQPAQKTEEEFGKQKLPGRWQPPNQDVKQSPENENPISEEIKRKNWPGRWQPPSE